MLNRIGLKNFKCFAELELELRGLNMQHYILMVVCRYG